ncbi:hypothetical protein AJ80_03110 [Polytolypa hystricis UAMH7299]|uniref:DUF7730 domain-containing protein n=1 Tax=Polytolypa hystricis (strain UAMH7299) TaxID=1447883 RepID=A0A2B7YK38_POLH7|nr:hypothetical protein AJ80_03110 [Polytolypa hystricis UAMH7299]
MGKRKRTKHSPAADKGESPSPSRLLSLPPETRQMIWKAVIDTYQFLLDGKTYSQGAPMVVEILGYIARPLAEIDQTCRCPQSSKKPKIHLLDWLQTNRQIYAEAKPTVYGNLAIHICDALVFNAFLSLPRSAVLRPESIRSLTLCVKIEIEPGLRDGFSFVNGECHGWRTGHPRGLCCCPYCFAAGGEGNDLVARFSALRELRLRAYFTCHKIVGHFDSEAAQTGQLRQPRSPTPLISTLNVALAATGTNALNIPARSTDAKLGSSDKIVPLKAANPAAFGSEPLTQEQYQGLVEADLQASTLALVERDDMLDKRLDMSKRLWCNFKHFSL